MAKFVFRLQSLLNVKAQMEDNLKNKLAKVIRKLEKEKRILQKLQLKESMYIENFKKKSRTQKEQN